MTDINLCDNVVALAERIKPAITTATGVVHYNNALEIALEGAPVTMDAIQQVRDFRNTFVAACTLAAGELAIATMKDDAQCERLTGNVSFGGDEVVISTTRSREVNAGIPAKGEAAPKKTVFGRTSTRFDAVFDKRTKEVSDSLVARATALLG